MGIYIFFVFIFLEGLVQHCNKLSDEAQKKNYKGLSG